MDLAEVRKEIDRLDGSLREELLRRLDCSEHAVRAKMESGDTTIYRPDREQEILEKLSAGVPEKKKREYLAVLKKILLTSRMYQYAILCDESAFDAASLLAPGVRPVSGGSKITVRVVPRSGEPGQLLGMITDYGCGILEAVPCGPEDVAEEGTGSAENAGETESAGDVGDAGVSRNAGSAENAGDAGNADGAHPAYRITFRGDFADPEISHLLFQLKNENGSIRITGVC